MLVFFCCYFYACSYLEKKVVVEPSIITEITWSERKLNAGKKSEGGKIKEGSLDIRPLCQTLSKTFEISRSTTKDSPKSLKEEAQTFTLVSETGFLSPLNDLLGTHVACLIVK